MGRETRREKREVRERGPTNGLTKVIMVIAILRTRQDLVVRKNLFHIYSVCV